MDKDKELPRNRKSDTRLVEKTADSDVALAERRRLIKASAAFVPAIMTLRSGAAAAAAAASLHICIEQDAERAAIELGPEDQVFGDSPDETALDQWVRIVGKAGRKVVKTSGTSKTWYCIRNKDSTAAWDDITGWDCYDDTSTLVNTTNNLKNYWDSATNFYCVNKAGVWECIDESGATVTPTIRPTDIDAGKDVYLLVYVASLDGEIIGATYYPRITLVQDTQASPITGSCLCSVDPNFNIQG
ncbi:MAG: hypothetical protein PVG72_11285 [Gammaproteobacteria bacterium]|jgi:hypothetical protein